MAQRSPPAALLELQQNFPTMSKFDGNWTSYELRFLTAISRPPAVVGLVLGQFLRPAQEDAAAFIFPRDFRGVNGLSLLGFDLDCRMQVASPLMKQVASTLMGSLLVLQASTRLLFLRDSMKCLP